MIDAPGIYVHLPWCVRKCPYCDFNSHPLKDRSSGDFRLYTDALLEDWKAQRASFEPGVEFATVFLGGGTPSLFPPAELGRLLSALPLAADAEVTMEANPGTTEYHNLGDYREAGINRLSIGAQSFDASQLQKLGRIHSVDNISRAFEAARRGGFSNINLDLMWGLPGQTGEAAMADLDAAFALGPEHISWYQLTIEPKTEFARRVPVLPTEDHIAEMETAGLARLGDAGYTRYEISAFARPGRECRHNLNYWRFGDYAGVGAGAHGKITEQLVVRRTAKPSSPRLYQLDPGAGTTRSVQPAELTLEYLMNALRLVEGTSFDTFETRTGIPWQNVSDQWRILAEEGLVESERCAATALGMRYLDSVLSRFV